MVKIIFLENKVVINFDCRRGAKKSGHLDYPFKSYGPKFVSMHKTCGEVGVQKKSHGHNFDLRSGAKKLGHLDYPFKSYGPKFVNMHKTCGEVGVTKKCYGYNFAFQVLPLNQPQNIPIGPTLIQYGSLERKIVAVLFFCDTAYFW